MQTNFKTLIYDVETTGLDRSKSRIVEISWILVDQNFERVKSQTTLINPGITIPQEVTAIHGITNSMVLGEPTFGDYWNAVLADLFMIDGLMIGGFNSKRFDDQILENEISRIGFDIPVTQMHSLDIGSLYKKLQPRTLEAAADDYLGADEVGKTNKWFLENREQRGDEDSNFHTAEFDAVLTAKVMRAMFERHELPTEAEALNKYIHKRDDSFIDMDGKFCFRGGKPIINFGKHAGSDLRGVADANPGYLKWIIGNDFNKDVKTICREALKGNFPEK